MRFFTFVGIFGACGRISQIFFVGLDGVGIVVLLFVGLAQQSPGLRQRGLVAGRLLEAVDRRVVVPFFR